MTNQPTGCLYQPHRKEKSDMGTTIESDWENTRLLEELEAARADIENVQLVSQLHYDANLSLRQPLAAAQPKNAGLRKLVEYSTEYRLGDPVYEQALATKSDTSALEAIVKKAGEVMRERCLFEADIAYHNKHCCEEIRALPAVTLEDLKGSE